MVRIYGGNGNSEISGSIGCKRSVKDCVSYLVNPIPLQIYIYSIHIIKGSLL